MTSMNSFGSRRHGQKDNTTIHRFLCLRCSRRTQFVGKRKVTIYLTIAKFTNLFALVVTSIL